MGDKIAQLQKEFCPPIDSSLFSALILDFDTENEQSLENLRTVLETLKQSALIEEASGFDPSGSSGGNVPDATESKDLSDRAQSWHGETDSVSGLTEETDLTEVSQALDQLELPISNEWLNSDLQALSPEEKSRTLREMFPGLKAFDINHVLKKSNNDFGRATEELLSQAFLASEEGGAGATFVPKGIEGFYDADIGASSRKKKGKKKRILRRSSSLENGDLKDEGCVSSLRSSRWDLAREEVDFIRERTHVPPQVISSTYHKQGGSMPATIVALCDSDEPSMNPYLSEASTQKFKELTTELVSDFPSISEKHASALIRLTYPSSASAHELGRALSSASTRSASSIIPQYSARPPSPPSEAEHLDLPKSSAINASHEALERSKNHAFSQASAAHRKAKSDHLMGGAAAYYSIVGRETAAALRKHQAAAADGLVATQSKHGQIDLHGVTVQDATRIALTKSNEWWKTEASEWSRAGKARDSDLRFITGKGRHSEGGKGRLGPAVAKALVQHGWKIEIGSGVIDVVGRARR